MNNKKRQYSLRTKMMIVNIGIAAIVFIICGGLFVFSINALIQKNARSDMAFFQTEISDNLKERISYMENIISHVRDSEVMMKFLREENEAQREFSEVVDINSSENQGKNGGAVIEEAYLISKNEAVISEYYYMLIPQEITDMHSKNERIFTSILKETEIARKFTVCHEVTEEKIFIGCPIFDDDMENCGTLIFGINRESVSSILDEILRYEGAFWKICNEKGQIILSSDQIPKNVGKNYNVYEKSVGMKWDIKMGVPINQASKIVFESVELYLLMVIIIFLAGIVSFVVFTNKITKPLSQISQKLQCVKNKDFKTKMPEYQEKEFAEISDGFNMMTSEINHLVNEVYEKQLLAQKLELKFLQSQMNPHFIFNVLNTIGIQAKIEKNEQLSDIVFTFAKFIRAKIYRNEWECIKIREELECVEDYLKIQKFRFGEKISYSLDVDEEIKEAYIPKLCIQPIVENAIIHGIEPKVGKGIINIRGFKEGQRIVIEVEDDGIGFTKILNEKPSDNSHNGVGLKNIHEILQRTYGDDYGIIIENGEKHGTKVKILISIKKEGCGKDEL